MVNLPHIGGQNHATEIQQTALQITIAGDVHIMVPNSVDLMTPYILTEQQDWFEDEIKFIRKLIQPGSNVLDIGANYGCYAMTMAKLIGEEGHLWAFEPANSTAGFLSESISINRFNNVTLIKAALSNRNGTAELSLASNSELNAITSETGSGQTESVPLKRLDDCIEHYQWSDIEFVKLDAEGEEVHILEGGEKFFSNFSPLVMFELKHCDQVNEGLIQKFISFGYETYILVPGLQILAPFNATDIADEFLLNLFCCKQDTATALADRGLLITEVKDSSEQEQSSDWHTHLSQFHYAKALMPTWQQVIEQQPLPGWEGYEQALNLYAGAHDNSSPEIRLFRLQQALITLISVLNEHASVPKLLTLIRIAKELGKRNVAVQTLHQIIQHFIQESTFQISEPFLAVSPEAEVSNPEGRLAEWCLAWVLREREMLQAYSSYFTGQDSLPAIDHFLTLGFEDMEMARRSNLIRMRFNLPANV